MTNLINLNNFLNHAIGFEDVFNRLSSLHTYNTGFPYYNIKKKGSDKYSLEMTLAGYKKSDIDVEVSDGIITITGKAGKEDKSKEEHCRGEKRNENAQREKRAKKERSYRLLPLSKISV